MDLRQLRYFLAVVDHGNVAKAADSLNMPRHSLYLHLDLIKDEFGTALLVTRQHQVSPTAAGQVLAEGARLIVDRFDAIREDIGKLAAP